MTVSHLEGLLHVQTNKMTISHLVCFVAQLAEECTSNRGHGFNSRTRLNAPVQLPVTRPLIFNWDNLNFSQGFQFGLIVFLRQRCQKIFYWIHFRKKGLLKL